MSPHDYIYLGTLVATVWYLRRDLNGMGRKTRLMTAEFIIASKDQPDFAAIVRRLLG